jgi:hypothetical protein
MHQNIKKQQSKSTAILPTPNSVLKLPKIRSKRSLQKSSNLVSSYQFSGGPKGPVRPTSLQQFQEKAQRKQDRNDRKRAKETAFHKLMNHREDKEEELFRAVDDDIVRLNTVMGVHRKITAKVRQRLGKSLE